MSLNSLRLGNKVYYLYNNIFVKLKYLCKMSSATLLAENGTTLRLLVNFVNYFWCTEIVDKCVQRIFVLKKTMFFGIQTISKSF